MDAIERELQNFFSGSSPKDWKNIAKQETNGKDPFETLSWHGKDEILYLPYYDADTEASLDFLKTFQLPAGKNSAPQSWLNLPSVEVDNEQAANTQAHQHLMQGADGVLYDVRNVGQADVNTLTNNIEWPACYIGFYLHEESGLLNPLSTLIKDMFLPAAVNGALFWESIPKKGDFNFYFDHCRNFQALGLLIPETSPAAEISDALLKGVHALEMYSAQADPQHVFRSISFSLAADASFMEGIAKFKALRMLWFQVARAYGQYDYNVNDLHVHARSAVVPDGTLGPHQNMLKGTFAAMAAILGGCDALTVETGTQASFIPRWGRNVSSILREESFFDRVADPLAGAWALDAMTDSIAKKAWELFRKKM